MRAAPCHAPDMHPASVQPCRFDSPVSTPLSSDTTQPTNHAARLPQSEEHIRTAWEMGTAAERCGKGGPWRAKKSLDLLEAWGARGAEGEGGASCNHICNQAGWSELRAEEHVEVKRRWLRPDESGAVGGSCRSPCDPSQWVGGQYRPCLQPRGGQLSTNFGVEALG